MFPPWIHNLCWHKFVIVNGDHFHDETSVCCAFTGYKKMSRCYQRLFQTSDLLVIRVTENIVTKNRRHNVYPRSQIHTHTGCRKDIPLSFSIFVFTGDQIDLHNRFTDRASLCTYPTSTKCLGKRPTLGEGPIVQIRACVCLFVWVYDRETNHVAQAGKYNTKLWLLCMLCPVYFKVYSRL